MGSVTRNKTNQTKTSSRPFDNTNTHTMSSQSRRNTIGTILEDESHVVPGGMSLLAKRMAIKRCSEPQITCKDIEKSWPMPVEQQKKMIKELDTHLENRRRSSCDPEKEINETPQLQMKLELLYETNLQIMEYIYKIN